MKRASVIFAVCTGISILLINPGNPAAGNRHYEADKVEDSLEDHEDRVADSTDKAQDREDRKQDSLQEFLVGPEGRTVRLSFVVSGTIRDGNFKILYTPSLSKRIGLIDIGLQDFTFTSSAPNRNDFLMTLSPSVGVIPVLTRPFRFSTGIGISFQTKLNDNCSTSSSPFLYTAYTFFYVKRISSTLMVRGRYVYKGDFNYWSSIYDPIPKGTYWIDMGMSVDFYF